MGKRKYTQEQKEIVIARLTLGESPTKIARDLGMPYGTVAYMKANLKETQEKDGSLGYHFEEKKKWTKTAWKAAQILIKKILEASKTVELRTPAHIKDTTSASKTLLDRIDKITPPPQLEAGKEHPLIGLDGGTAAEMEIIIAKIKQIRKTALPQLENGEIIEGESREIE